MSGALAGDRKNRWLGIATAVAAALLLVVGVFSREWLRGLDLGIETHLGLRAAEICQEVSPSPDETSRACETVALDAMTSAEFAPAGSARFHTLATLAYGTGLAAAGLVLLCALLGLANRPIDLPIHPTTLGILACAGALACGSLAMALNPYTKLTGWGSGRGFVLFGLGAALGLFGSIVLGRARPAVPSEFD